MNNPRTLITLLDLAVLVLIASNLIWVASAFRASDLAKEYYANNLLWQNEYKTLSADQDRLINDYNKEKRIAADNKAAYETLDKKNNELIGEYNGLAARYIATYKDAKMAEMKLGIISGVVKDFGDGMCVDAVSQGKDTFEMFSKMNWSFYSTSVDVARRLGSHESETDGESEEGIQILLQKGELAEKLNLTSELLEVDRISMSCMGGYKAIQITIDHK
jgi:hypothetical protein